MEFAHTFSFILIDAVARTEIELNVTTMGTNKIDAN